MSTTTTIWKITRPVNDRVTFTFPAPAKILHVACEQPTTVSAWAEVDPESAETIEQAFVIVGTGHPLPERGEHVATAVAPPFVWHIYEATR